MLVPISLFQKFTDLQLPSYPSITGLPPSINIQIQSLENFSFALGWAWILLLSFTGWGRLAGKIARVQRLPASVACALGISSLIFLGGLLNLVQGLYAGVLIGLVIAGLVFYLLFYRARPMEYRWSAFWQHASPWVKFFCVAALVILAFRAAGTVRLGMFNNLDDGPAYLVFPHKLIASHAFAFDPFSDRRVISSLGGAYLLQGFVIVATSLTHIGMADRTLGLILLAGALFDLGIAFELSAWQIAALEFLAFLVPQQTINLTFVILPTSLLIAMVWFILQTPSAEDRVRLRYALLVGALGGAVISLKSTFLPCIGAFALIPYLMLFSRERRSDTWRLPLLAGVGCLVILVPWMISMKLNSGTYLFPLLGYGVDYASYGLLHAAVKFTSTRSFIKIFLQAIALLILACIQVMAGAWERRARLSLSILIASAIAITAFNYKSGGDFIWRYNFPQFFVAIIVFYAATAAALHRKPAGRWVRDAFYCGVASLAAMIFYYDVSGKQPRPFREIRLEHNDYRDGLRASLTGISISSPRLITEYKAAEESLPIHSRAIENTAYPFLFGYGNQTIFLSDWPGAAGPKPGWPFGSDVAGLVRYLESQNIRYVVYDYQYARWVDMEGCEALEKTNINSQELLALWQMTVVTHNQFDHLRSRYQSIYDDGKIEVIDLGHPIANASADGPVWTLNTDKDEMCSAVMARYLANPLPAQAE
jgi:hypothetical protein